MNERKLLEFIEHLRAAQSFEDGAEITLRQMLDVAKAVLAASPYAKLGRVLRGMVHLRPGDGYKRLIVVHDRTPSSTPAIAYTPSASAFRWVVEHARPVAVDVPIGRVRTLHEKARGVTEGGFSSLESAARLTNREASHLYAVPLRSLRGLVEGMATVECGCAMAIGEEFIFPDVAEPLQLLADIASPFLASLPLRPVVAAPTDDLLPVIGSNMAGLVEMLRIFAQQEETLLIGGPTGAGKSRLAQYCHAHSARKDHPFEVLDLVTVPEDLQMAELFGWRKGAFTGAVRDTPGAVARALKGTLFIDEIDKLSLKAQAGLLHLLEARTYRPLGDGSRELPADVRFIIGSNVDLHELVKAGRFREDLYYRINVLPIKVPPLDERQDEIAEWARFMAVRRHRATHPEGEVHLTAGAERVLGEHSWPGNLRQLDNVVRRAYALALMTQGNAGRELVLDEHHFARALRYEEGATRKSLADALRAAALSFVEEAERLEERGAALDLDQAEAFRGVVLATAIQRIGRDPAFRLLGKATYVQGRNQHKMLRREIEKVETLCKAVGIENFIPPEIGEDQR